MLLYIGIGYTPWLLLRTPLRHTPLWHHGLFVIPGYIADKR